MYASTLSASSRRTGRDLASSNKNQDSSWGKNVGKTLEKPLVLMILSQKKDHAVYSKKNQPFFVQSKQRGIQEFWCLSLVLVAVSRSSSKVSTRSPAGWRPHWWRPHSGHAPCYHQGVHRPDPRCFKETVTNSGLAFVDSSHFISNHCFISYQPISSNFTVLYGYHYICHINSYQIISPRLYNDTNLHVLPAPPGNCLKNTQPKFQRRGAA